MFVLICSVCLFMLVLTEKAVTKCLFDFAVRLFTPIRTEKSGN